MTGPGRASGRHRPRDRRRRALHRGREEVAARWAAAIAADLASPDRPIALDRLETALAAANVAIETSEPARHHAPSHRLHVGADDSCPDRRRSGVPARGQYATLAIDQHARAHPARRDRRSESQAVRRLGAATTLNGSWRRVEKPSSELDTALTAARIAGTVDELSGRSERDKAGPSLQDFVPAIHVATVPTGVDRYRRPPENSTPVHGVRCSTCSTDGPRPEERPGLQDLRARRRPLVPHEQHLRLVVVRLAKRFAMFRRYENSRQSPIETSKASIPGTERRERLPSTRRSRRLLRVLPRASVRGWLRSSRVPTTFRPIEGTSLEYAVEHHDAAHAPRRRVVRNDRQRHVANGVVEPRSLDASSVGAPRGLHGPPTSPIYYASFVRVLATEGDTVFVGQFPGYRRLRTSNQSASSSSMERAMTMPAPGCAATRSARRTTYGFGSNLTFTPWTGWTVAFGFGWAWGDAVLANGRGWGVYPWWQRANARVVEAATNRPVGIHTTRAPLSRARASAEPSRTCRRAPASFRLAKSR